VHQFGDESEVIKDLNHWTEAWIDWNLILNQAGGPNLAGNFVDSPVYKRADDHSTFYQNPSFFHLAHFSKYIPPGSKRVDFSVQCGASRPEYCQAVAFLRPDGLIAIVVLNCGDYIIDFKLRDGQRSALARIPPHTIQTYLLQST